MLLWLAFNISSPLVPTLERNCNLHNPFSSSWEHELKGLQWNIVAIKKCCKQRFFSNMSNTQCVAQEMNGCVEYLRYAARFLHSNELMVDLVYHWYTISVPPVHFARWMWTAVHDALHLHTRCAWNTLHLQMAIVCAPTLYTVNARRSALWTCSVHSQSTHWCALTGQYTLSVHSPVQCACAEYTLIPLTNALSFVGYIVCGLNMYLCTRSLKCKRTHWGTVILQRTLYLNFSVQCACEMYNVAALFCELSICSVQHRLCKAIINFKPDV